MDWLRSCYKSEWNLPGVGVIGGRYFWSAEDAQPFPGFHLLGSRNWHWGDRTEWPEFGETETARQKWVNGSIPLELPNQTLIGEGQQLGSELSGITSPAPVGLVAGIDRRCYLPELPMAPTVQTYCKLVESAQYWGLSMSGWVNAPPFYFLASNLNGDFVIPYVSGCQWRRTTGINLGGVTVNLWVQRGLPAFPLKWCFRIATGVATGTHWQYELSEADFRMNEPNVLTLTIDGAPPANPPATVTIVPTFP